MNGLQNQKGVFKRKESCIIFLYILFLLLVNEAEWVRDVMSGEALGAVRVEFQILMEVRKANNNIKTLDTR